MPIWRIIVPAVSFVIILSDPTFAGWQDTEWGMRRDELQKIVPGIVENQNRMLDNDDMQAELTAPFALGQLQVNAYFYFKNEGLALVTLVSPTINDCFGARASLEETYGPPRSDAGALTYELVGWRDFANANDVSFLFMEGLEDYGMPCLITFKPISLP